MTSRRQHPISDVTTALAVADSPQLSEIYATILRLHRPTVDEVSTHVDCALSTVYRSVNRLQQDGFLKQVENQQPYRYEAADIRIRITTLRAEYQIEPLLIVASAHRTDHGPLDEFVQRRGIGGLARALELAKKRVTTDSHGQSTNDTVDVPESVLNELYDIIVDYEGTHTSTTERGGTTALMKTHSHNEL